MASMRLRRQSLALRVVVALGLILSGGSFGFVVPPRSRCSPDNGCLISPLTRLQERSDGVDGDDAANTTLSNTGDQPALRRQEEDIGIGGKGGLVYDVNRLKRNLLQETMTAYKEELWDLLADGDDGEIVEKLLALVQASPVRTTTDSNLLDNKDEWFLAYRSQYPTTVSSLVLYENYGKKWLKWDGPP